MPSPRYEDLSEALEWLSRAFGLKEHLRWADEDGTVIHAEMRIADAFVELFAGPPGSDRSTEGHGCHALVVLVDDVDGHYRRARKAGALVIAEPEDKPWGLRQYTAQDPGGHRWEFSQHLRDVPPAEWGAQLIE